MPGQSTGSQNMEIAKSSLLGSALTYAILLMASPVPVSVAQVPAQLQGFVTLQSATGAVFLLRLVPTALVTCGTIIMDNLPARLSIFQLQEDP